MNPIAEQLNREIEAHGPAVAQMLSRVGRQLFFPKGILSQGAEAKEKGHRINATIGIAKEEGRTMVFDSVMAPFGDIDPGNLVNYAPSFGLPDMRAQWREEMHKKNPSLENKPISLPVVTCGITHAVSVFADLWVDPGDVILVPDKFWGNYNMIFQVRKGADLQHYPLFTDDYRLNLAGVRGDGAANGRGDRQDRGPAQFSAKPHRLCAHPRGGRAPGGDPGRRGPDRRQCDRALR